MREHRLGYRETVRKCGEDSKGKEPNYIKRVQRWEHTYLEGGSEWLMKKINKTNAARLLQALGRQQSEYHRDFYEHVMEEQRQKQKIKEIRRRMKANGLC